MEAAAKACEDPTRNYLLHIDEINRADLGKILGEAIYLFEPDPESPRELSLAYDFGAPFFRKLRLPDNLHVLGTMNSADRSIAILDVAVCRRFAFLSLWPSLKVVEEHGCELSQKALRELVSTFIEHPTEEALPLVPGHSYFLGKDDGLARTNLKTSLVPLLTEYLAQGYVSGFARSGTPLETIWPSNDICLELRDHTRVTKSAVAFFGSKAPADPGAQAARLADQFIRQNAALFQLPEVSIQRGKEGRCGRERCSAPHRFRERDRRCAAGLPPVFPY
jgi:hypothetical protein